MQSILRGSLFIGSLFLALLALVLLGPTYELSILLLVAIFAQAVYFLRNEKSQRSNNKLQKAIRSSARVSIIATDVNGLITEFSKGSEELLGYTREEMVGKMTPQSLHDSEEVLQRNEELNREFNESNDPGFTTFVRKVYRDNKDEREWTYIHKNGTRIPVILSITPIKDSHQRIRGFLGVATDITNIKEKEDQYVKAKEEADIANASKSNFLANMSHEIRTPLNGVIGMSKLLYESTLNEEQQDITKTLIKSSLQLKTILNDILDFTKIESGSIKLSKNSVNLREFNTDIINLLSSSNEKSDLDLELVEKSALPNLVKFDEVRLRQVLLNISLNALKFTEAGKVSVEVSFDDDKLFYRVIDTGIGFDETRLTQLLNPFVKGSSDDLSKKGTGLGLAIVRELLALMDGGISVISEVGKGTTFTISIPAPRVDADQKQKSIPDTLVDLTGVNVLVVEDNDINQKVIERILLPTHAHFEIVEDGKEAVRLAMQKKFDIILMDYQLPLLNGVDATKEIRKTMDIPIIALTANAYEEDREACLLAGMNEFLSKPVDPNELRKVIKNHTS